MEGWIKIHRKLLEWEWYDDTNTKVLFIHLLLKCNHKKKKWRGKEINPGEIIIGITEFGAQIGLSRQQVRTSFNKLISTNEITIYSTPNYSLVKLNKWDDYQTDNQQNNQRITNEQPTNNQRITTTKECKKERKKELSTVSKDTNSALPRVQYEKENGINISTLKEKAKEKEKNSAQKEKESYGNPGINKMLLALKGALGIDAFADSRNERNIGKHLVSLFDKVGKQEFKRRLDYVMGDDFRRKNCNSITYLYNQLKSVPKETVNKNIIF